MQGKSKSLTIKLVSVLIVVGLIKCGTSAPRNPRLENASQKAKRSAGFMNYLSSVFFESSFNYPDYSWNSIGPSYETSYIQYPGNSADNDLNGPISTILSNDYNWPDHNMKEISLFEDFPKNANDRALYLTNVGKDDSFTYVLKNDCDYDLSEGTNDLNWNFPPQGIDESIFNNFYLLPDEEKQNEVNVPVITEKPIEVNLNKIGVDKTPNISIFNCVSEAGKTEIIEKVLSNKDDEYMVLFIKRNPFLGGKMEENKTEVVLEQPRPDPKDTEEQLKTIAVLPLEVHDDEAVVNQQVDEVDESINEIVGSSVEPKNVDPLRVNLDLDFKENGEKETSTLVATTNVSTHVASQEESITTSKILVKEEDHTDVLNSSSIVNKTPSINIPNEDSLDIQANVEDPIPVVSQTIETEDLSESEKKISEEPLNEITNSENHSNAVIEEKNEVKVDIKTTVQETNSNSEVENIRPDENPEVVTKQETVPTPDVLTSSTQISVDVPTSDISSNVYDSPNGSEGSSHSTVNEGFEIQKDDAVIVVESPAQVKEEIVLVTSTNPTVTEDQKTLPILIKNIITEEATKTKEDIELPKDNSEAENSYSVSPPNLVFPIKNVIDTIATTNVVTESNTRNLKVNNEPIETTETTVSGD